jgi:hypothetical protein
VCGWVYLAVRRDGGCAELVVYVRGGVCMPVGCVILMLCAVVEAVRDVVRPCGTDALRAALVGVRDTTRVVCRHVLFCVTRVIMLNGSLCRLWLVSTCESMRECVWVRSCW